MVALAAVAVVVLAGCNWNSFSGLGSDNTRWSPDTGLNTSNVGSLITKWTGATGGQILTSSPAVVNGVAYVGSSDDKLYAYDANGVTNCGGTPVETCSPLWTASTGGSLWDSSPTVHYGVVYVGSGDGKLYAYDANGVTNCGGTPKTCSPLWTATTGGGVESSPNVVNGVVYVGSRDGKLYAYDANGVTNCGGTPKTCSPLWTATTGAGVSSSPAVANGVVYVGSDDDKLYAYDANGVTNCGGTPKTCSPLWTAATIESIDSSPAVSNSGVVYVGSSDGNLYAFDAKGATNCGGTPKTCSPLWSAVVAGENSVLSSPAVANGVVYVGAGFQLDAFEDSSAPKNCISNTCSPLWTVTTRGDVDSSPAVANGVVYVGSYDDKLYAIDANGVINCGGTPKTCSPLGTATTGGGVVSSPAVANGVVYVGSFDGKLYAFSPNEIQ